MESIDVLYDHYKDTNTLQHEAQKQRDCFFNGLCIAEMVNLLFMLRPSDVISIVSSWFNDKYTIALPSMVSVFQVAIWIVVTYFIIVYVKRNMYIERQYGYIAELEQKISEITGSTCFDREGDFYQSNYPFVLNVIDVFYKWIVPLGLCLIHVVKIVNEIKYKSSCAILCADIIICAFTIILIGSYFVRIAVMPLFHKEKENDNTAKSS